MEALIQVKQLPIIEEQLRSMKADVDKRVEDALSLVCTEETVQSVKAVRADLNKEFQALEAQRKEVKKAVLGPYEQFEMVYKECVSDAYRWADLELKKKISDVEADLKKRCEDGLREYFAELCAAERVDFVRYEQAGIVVDMASAKQKTPKKLREKLAEFVSGIARSMELISGMDDAEEIMAEFKRSLDAPAAISTVQERHRRIEAEKEDQMLREEQRAREARRGSGMNNEIKNISAIAEFEESNPAPRRVGAELAASREAQEVQVAMVAAKRFPRDEVEAYNRILRDCQRPSLAEKAMYEFPRGGQVVTGPSIHLAKTLARGWGNIDSGFKVLEQTAKESTVMAYCWDLETNYRETKVFTVPHVRETKKGAYPLTDPRDI